MSTLVSNARNNTGIVNSTRPSSIASSSFTERENEDFLLSDLALARRASERATAAIAGVDESGERRCIVRGPVARLPLIQSKMFGDARAANLSSRVLSSEGSSLTNA